MDFPLTDIAQFGALGMFVWYTINNNREWRQYLTERNSKLEKSLDKLANAIDNHYGKTDSHTHD